MKKLFKVAAVAAFFASVMGAAAADAQILRFDNPDEDGGTLTYDGAGGGAVGNDIIFQNVIGTDTSLNSGVTLFFDNPNTLPEEFGLLDFVTGPNTVEGPPLYQWGPGGSITLSGTLYDAAGNVVASGVILQGEWGESVALANGQLQFIGAGIDVKNTDLAAFYGISTLADFSNSELNVPVVINPTTKAFTGTVVEGDLTNVPQVPAPSALVLLGLGLSAMGALRLRKK